MPEVIFAKGKTSAQVVAIAQRLLEHTPNVLITRATEENEAVIDTDPAEAKRALQVIESTSRSTMNEFRRVLGLLREGNGAAKTSAERGGPV